MKMQYWKDVNFLESTEVSAFSLEVSAFSLEVSAFSLEVSAFYRRSEAI